jgi:hypothetical protein
MSAPDSSAGGGAEKTRISQLGNGGDAVGSVVKKRKKKMRRHKHKKLMARTRHQRRKK